MVNSLIDITTKLFVKYWLLILVFSTTSLYANPVDLKVSYALEYEYNYIGALKTMEKLIAENPKSYFNQLRAGWLAYMSGYLAKSVDHYQAAIVLKPESVEPRMAQMLPLMALGRYKQAEMVALATLKLDQHNYTAKSRLAYSLYLSGQYKESEKYYSDLVKLYPSDTTMLMGLGWAQLKQGKKKNALETFYQAHEILPGNKQVEDAIAICNSEN